MISFLVSIFILLFLPTMLGIGIVGVLQARWGVFGIEGKISLSFLTGCFILGLMGSVMLRYGIPLSYAWVSGIGLLGLLFGSVEIFRSCRSWKTKRLTWGWVEICIYGLLFLGLILNANMPVMEWDAIALYDFRAKIFTEGLVIEDLQESVKDVGYFRYYYAYPLMSSILHSWGYLWGLDKVLVLYSGFYASIGLLLLDVARNFRTRFQTITRWLIVGCLTTPLLLSHAFIAYTNLMYAAFLLAGLVTAFVGIRKEKTGWVFYSVFLLMACLLTRLNEPFYLSILFPVIGYFLLKKKWLLLILYPLLLLGLRQWWTAYAVFDDVLELNSVGVIFEKFSLPFFIEVETFLIMRYMAAIKSALVLAALALGLRLWTYRSLPWYWLVFWTINGGLLTIGGFFFALQMSFWKDISGSAERMMIAFVPIIYFWAMEMFATIDKNEHLQKK